MPVKEAEELLARWREAERELGAATPGSPEEDRLAALVYALREEYQRMVSQQREGESSGEPQPSG